MGLVSVGLLSLPIYIVRKPGSSRVRRWLLMTGMVSTRGRERIDGQMTSVSEAGCARLYGYVKRSSLNSAGYLEFPERTVGVRTSAKNSA